MDINKIALDINEIMWMVKQQEITSHDAVYRILNLPDIKEALELLELKRQYGLSVEITGNSKGSNPPYIKDNDGKSILIWQDWGKALNMIDGKGTLLYIPSRNTLREE